MADGRRPEPAPGFEGVGDAEAGERGLEWRAEAVGRRDDERDPFGRDPAAK